jgi:hypothetical protein
MKNATKRASGADGQFSQAETLYFSFQVESYQKVDKKDDYSKQDFQVSHSSPGLARRYPAARERGRHPDHGYLRR